MSVALSSDDRLIVSGSSDHSIKIFDLETETELHHFVNAHEGSLFWCFYIYI